MTLNVMIGGGLISTKAFDKCPARDHNRTRQARSAYSPMLKAAKPIPARSLGVEHLRVKGFRVKTSGFEDLER